MAKYLLADMVDRPLGSIGGSVFQKIGGVYSIRNHSIPTDKKRISQFHNRNRFESIQQRFRNLDVGDKATWADQAVNYPRMNSLGGPYLISAINLQQSSNTYAFNIGSPLIDSIPVYDPPPGFVFDTIAFEESFDVFDIILDPIQIPAGFNLVVYATQPLSPGTLSPGTVYRSLGSLPALADTSLVNWFDAYITAWFEVNQYVGSQIFVTAQLISVNTFQPGVTVYGSGFVE